MNAEPVRVSWQRTPDGTPLGKAHSIDAAGRLQSAMTTRWVKGCIAVETEVRTLNELLDQAVELGGCAHRFSGTFEPGTDGQVLRSGGEAPGATKDFLAHRPGPGVLCIDIDKGHGFPWTEHGQVVSGLRSAVPWLAGSGFLVIDSSSSCIAVDGKEERGPGGFHAYVLVDDATQIPALLEDGHRRCYLGGLGRLFLTGAAILLPRSPFDLALRVETQPDFMVPHLGSPRISRSRGPTLIEGGRVPATAELLPAGEVKRYEAILAGDKARQEPERARKAEEVAQERGRTAQAKHGGDLASHVAAVRTAIDKRTLALDFDVPLRDGSTRTVAELLANPALAGSGWFLPDPLDPDYGPGKAMLNADRKVITSMAHGLQTVYRLGWTAAEDDGRRPLVASRITLADVRSPPRERTILGRTIPLAKPSVLFGPSGVGKSALEAQIVAAVSSGAESLFDLPIIPGGGPVLVYTAEDTLDDWKRKLAAIDCAGGVDIERAISRLRVIDQTEGMARLSEIVTVRAGGQAESVTRYRQRPTEEQDELIRIALDLRAIFILVETASRLVDEEDNSNLAALMSALGRIARETGAGVLVSHHPTKNSARDNDSAVESARGGGALIANSRNALSLFPAEPDEAAAFNGRFPAKDVLVLAHGKSTSSTRAHDPITIIRTETPWGAVLRLPEDINLDPEQAQRTAARVGAEREKEYEAMRRLYAVVESMLPLGQVSMTRLRNRVTDIGVPKRNLEGFIARAVKTGVLKTDKRAGSGGGTAIFLGHDPRGPIAGTAWDGNAGTGNADGAVLGTRPLGRGSGTTKIVPTHLHPPGTRDDLRDDLGRPGTTPSIPTVREVLRRHESASMPMLMAETGQPHDVVLDELDQLNAIPAGDFYRLPEVSP